MEFKNDYVKHLRLMDNVLMSLVFNENIEAAELVLRIILDDPHIDVLEVSTQRELRSADAAGRTVKLDILASDSKRNKFNVEIQRDTGGANARRARYHSSMLDSGMLKSGEDFTALPDSYMIFITESDVMGDNIPIYHIERFTSETKGLFGDGSHIIYVNGKCHGEGTKLGRLMHDFCEADPDKMHNKVLADSVRYFKEERGGSKYMKDVWQEMQEEAMAEGELKGKAIGIQGAVEMCRELNVPDSEIVKKIMQKYGLTHAEAEKFVSSKATA